MNKFRALQLYSLFIIVTLITLLSVYAYKFKRYEKYYDLESTMVENAKSLLDFKDKTSDKAFTSVVIPENEVYESNMSVKNDVCNGYVELKRYLFIYSYKAYIKCNNYKTVGYAKNS